VAGGHGHGTGVRQGDVLPADGEGDGGRSAVYRVEAVGCCLGSISDLPVGT